MTGFPWILAAALIPLIVLGVVALVISRKKEHRLDYYALFVMGIIWLPLGIPLDNPALSIMGLVFALAGLKNKDRWRENRRTLADMDAGERRLMVSLIALLGALLLAGVIAFYFAGKGML